MAHPPRSTLGWREWVSLPEHGVEWMKAKVDTGARTSSLHAFGIEAFTRDGVPWVRFEVHPWQRSTGGVVTVEAPVLDLRWVRSSSGERERRHVVSLPVRVAGQTTTVEVTLANRDAMGFRMLLGRQALRPRFLVDPGRSYLGARPPRATREANRAELLPDGDLDDADPDDSDIDDAEPDDG